MPAERAASTAHAALRSRDAFAASAIYPDATLGDLRACLPPAALASWTIADLRDYKIVVSNPPLVTRPMTIGDLLESLPQPNNFTLADVLLLVLGSPNGAQGLSFESLNLFDTGLPEIATGGSTIDYRAQFDVQPNGGPAGGLDPVDRHVHAAARLPLRAGKLEAGLERRHRAPTPTPTGDPASATLGDGRLELTWTLDTTVGSGYAVCFTARPGILLGPQAASLTVDPTGLPTWRARRPRA